MKQIFTISNQLIALGKRLAMVLTVLFTLGVGSIWAETAKLTFTAACKGSGTDDKGNAWTITSDGTESTYDSDKGIHYGTSKATVQYIKLSTSDISGTITSVKVNASTASGVTATVAVKVGTSNFTTNSQTTATLSTIATDYTFTGSASGEILVTITKATSAKNALYCKSVEVTYTSSGGGNTGGDSGDDSGDSGDDSDGEYTWELVTDASTLKAGDEVVIAASTANYALSTTQRTSNRQAVAITKSDDAITINENVQVITLTTATNSQTNTFSFHVGTGFLYASSSSSNELKTTANPGQDGDWNLEIKNTGVASIIAKGDKTRNVMQFNLNNNNPAIFACYSSASQTSLAIYKKVCSTKLSVTFDLNGGSGTFEDVTLDGNTYDIPETEPTLNGYNFVGWQINGEGNLYQPGATIDDITDPITLVAQWTAKTATTLTWSPTSYSATIDADNTFPTLTITPADLSPIAYSSSNTGVATIDADGNITLRKKGATTITATFAETDTHIGATASYTLTVNPSNCRWVETDIANINSDDEVIVAMVTPLGVYALDHSKGTSAYPPAYPITVEGNVIISTPVAAQAIWNISGNATDGYILYPNGSTTTWLYCTASNYNVKVGKNADNLFIIDDGYLKNKTHKVYVGVYNSSDWRHYPANTGNAIANQTLKFYKKTCLPANEFWIDYELANVTCTNTPPHSQVDRNGEDLLLEFSANERYKLPESISVSIGNNILPADNDVYSWDRETGELRITAANITDNIIISISGCEKLSAPTGLAYTNITSSAVTLSWNAVQNAESYTVYVTDGTNDITKSTSECNVTISGLTKNTQYTWDVIATADAFCENEHSQAWIEFTTLDVFSVTFNNQGKGSAPASQNVDAGSKATVPTVPTTTGYTFAGWYTEAACTDPFDFSTTITEDITLYAKWDIWTYAITYAAGTGEGITGSHESQTKNYNSALTLAGESFSRPGYKQTGWSKTDGGQKDYDLLSQFGENANTTLYPYWTKVHTITWMADRSAHDEATYLDGETLALPETDPEACQGSEFVGWTAEQNYSHATDAPAYITAGSIVNADAIYYAVYAEVTLGEPIKEEITNTYTFSNYTAGTQYATNEEHILDEDVTIYTTQCHFTTELRIYASNTHNGYVESNKLPGNIISIGFNAGDNSDNLLVYGSENGSDWNQIGKVAVNSSYKDYTLDFGETDYTYFKLDVEGSSQIRIKSMFITYMRVSEEVSTDYINYSTSCIPTYHVNYELAGGENGCADKGVKVGNDYTICNEEPTRTGYTFQYWTDGTNTYEAGATIYDVQADITLTATWKEREKYTLTFNDQGESKEFQYTESLPVEMQEPWAEICSGPIQYVFDGWATASVNNGTAEYEKVDFSTFTMPAANTTLYAVYRYAEDGKEPVNGFVKVTEALTDWSGDYVIVNEDVKKAIRNAYKDSDKNTLEALDVAIENNEIVLPSEDIIWQIRKDGENYTMYNADAGTYAYITAGDSKNAGLSDSKENITISWGSDATTIRVCGSGGYTARCFSYYKDKQEWRTYSTTGNSTGALYRLSEKTILYTSSLICGSITAEDALVTSTKDQKVKVKVPITLESSTGATTVTATSDNAAFAVTGLTDVEAGDYTIEVEYTPAEYNTTETANITLSATNGATTTFTVTGRSLPENFVIATKVGATWYALPANMSGATNPEGVLIDVDETTMTATAPNTTVYTLFPVATVDGNSDRYNEYGERLRFAAVNNGNRGLWANDAKSGTTINNDAAITAANSTAGAAYEWKITTTIVDGNWQYTLQTDQPNNQKYLRYWTAASGGAKWGTYASGNDKLYFLPVTETKPFDYKVVEWYPTKVLIQTEAAITNPIVKIGGILVDNVTCTNKGGKLYEISGLPLVNNPTKVLTLSYTVDEVTYTNSKVVPIILSRETKSISGEPFVALTKEVYNYADLVVRDGATLTMDGTQEANTLWDVTIYPTSKISVPESKKLTVHSLTFFGGIDEIYNGSTYILNKYGVPELSLKGSLKKSISTIDYLMRVNLDQMYSLSVPYDVQLADIKYWDGSDIALGAALYVSAYDGAARANQSKKTWIYETDFESKLGAATLKAGVGYTISAELQSGVGSEYSILRMPMTSNVENDATEGEKKVSVTAHGIDANITDNHKGWNLVGNPYMTTITGADDDDLVLGYLQETGSGPWEWVEKTYRYVTIPADNGKDYSQQKFTDAVLPPFKNFFVQIGTSGDLVFGLSTRKNMRAHHSESSVERDVEFEILMSNATRQDNTGLLISEGYSPAYEINADLEKMMGSMSIYTIYNGYTLAYNALSPINASEWIPMGYIAPAAGEYTFSLDDVENIAEQVEHVYIIDYNANNIVDLMDEEYKFTTDKEQNDNRFAINVVLSQDKDNTTTGLDIIQGNNAAPIKFIYHDKIYIQSGGVIYDATGKQVTNINK